MLQADPRKGHHYEFLTMKSILYDLQRRLVLKPLDAETPTPANHTRHASQHRHQEPDRAMALAPRFRVLAGFVGVVFAACVASIALLCLACTSAAETQKPAAKDSRSAATKLAAPAASTTGASRKKTAMSPLFGHVKHD